MSADVRAARPEDLEDPPRDVVDVEEIWRRTLGLPGRHVLVAADGDRVVGTADCLVLENLTRGARPYVLVENIVVDEAHQRRGIGASLLAAARDLASKAGGYKLQLIADDTPETRGFYESCGFAPEALAFKQRL